PSLESPTPHLERSREGTRLDSAPSLEPPTPHLERSREGTRLDSARRSEDDRDVPQHVRELGQQFLTAPRHLGIHSGGMVLTERPIGEVCPIERARMDNRTVLQWDKDACAYMGLVKFDLLGLGMLGALDDMITMAAAQL